MMMIPSGPAVAVLLLATVVALLLTPVPGFSFHHHHHYSRHTTFGRNAHSHRHHSSFPTRYHQHHLPVLFQQPPQSSSEPDTTTGRPSVRFSNEESSLSGLEAALSWIISDLGSIVLGGVGIVLLLVGRLVLSGDTTSTDVASSYDAVSALGEETRFNILAVLACCAVLVNGLSKLDVTTALAETVQLRGVLVSEPVFLGTDPDDEHFENPPETRTLSWLLQAVLTATPAETAVLLEQRTPQQQQQPNNAAPWKVVAYGGIVPTTDPSTLAIPNDMTTPILNRFLLATTAETNDKSSNPPQPQESYLPTLQALPGRTEFVTYLPINTQAVLLVPLRAQPKQQTNRVLVLGANQAKSLTPRDIAWCQAAVQRVSGP